MVESACEPSQAALYMWDSTIGSCYSLITPPDALRGAARRRMGEVLEEVWSAELTPVETDVCGADLLIYPLFHGTERAGLLVLVGAPSEFSPTVLSEFTAAAYYLVVTAIERVERLEAERRQSELEVTRSRMGAALAESHEQRLTIERMAASLESARADIEASRDHLEEQVVQRTGELAAANLSLQEASRLAQASSDAKSRFLAIMSHELRTPLTSILGAAELLSDQDDLAENELVSTVRNAGRDVLGIVSDVLDFSRLEAGEVQVEAEPFSVAELLEHLSETFAHRAESSELTFELKSQLPPNSTLRGDRAHVERVLEILIDNALKYTPAGDVRVTAKNMEGAPCIVVGDTGPGIPADVQERVFAAFEQADTSNARQFEGAGLGLAIARSLAELIGGRLTLTSTEGQGAEFALVLPKSAFFASPASPGRLSKERDPQEGPARVLLVEDNAVNRRIVARLLTRIGHEVIEARDGKEAVARAIADGPSVILMDIQMPKMDGLEATRRIRERSGVASEVPILALTANATPGERVRAFDSGMDAFLVKPIQIDTLRKAINDALLPTRP